MKGKAIIPLVLGLAVGVVAVKIGVDAIKKAQGSVPVQETVKIARAKVDIGAYEKIRPEMLEFVDVPDSGLISPSERIGEPGDVVGRVTAKAIPQQAPILKSMLAPPGTPSGMVGRIPRGYRAVSVKIDEVTSVAYQLKPGDWVDVIVVMDVTTNKRRGGRKETIAERILQNVQIAAIGRTTSGEQAAGGKMKPAKSATLFVTEEDAPKLHLAATRGKVTLAMRGEDDAISNKPSVVRDSDVFDALKDEKPAPVAVTPVPKPVVVLPPPDPTHSVVVYHGTGGANAGVRTERVTFKNADSQKIVSVQEGAAVAPTMSPRSRYGSGVKTVPTDAGAEKGRNNQSDGDGRNASDEGGIESE